MIHRHNAAMSERNALEELRCGNALLSRLGEVVTMLHLEQGDREQLKAERSELIAEGKRLGLFPQKPEPETAF
jgi:hypothetical protein